MKNNRIACVEYHNTIPFIRGLDHYSSDFSFELFKAPPSQCAELFRTHKVDVSLVPVATLSSFEAFEIMDSYCLGCDGEVYSVALLSQVPLDQITEIYLDPQSRTSNQLVQVLAREYWNIDPVFNSEFNGYDNESQLLIGDKVFELESNYKYKYDLGTAWKAMTGLPFVFAVWIKHPSVDEAWTKQLMEIFDVSFEQKALWTSEDVNFSKELLHAYLHKHIQFIFDMKKRQALDLFLSLIK